MSRLYDMEVRGSRPGSSASSNQMNHGESHLIVLSIRKRKF